MIPYDFLTDNQKEQVAAMFDPRFSGNPRDYIYEITRDKMVLCRKYAPTNAAQQVAQRDLLPAE